GIAGEDDLDAPDLTTPAVPAAASGGAPATSGTSPVAASGRALPGRRATKSPNATLSPERSMAVRQQLSVELEQLTDTASLSSWADRVLPLKDRLSSSDAEEIEAAFAAKLNQVSDPAAERDPRTEVARVGNELAPSTPSRPLETCPRPIAPLLQP